MSYFAVYSILPQNGILEEEDILEDEALEVEAREGRSASPSASILDLEEEMELGSQQDRGSRHPRWWPLTTLAPVWTCSSSLFG